MVASLLVAITAVTGKAAELTSPGSATLNIDALVDEAVSESVLWSFDGDDGAFVVAGLIADARGNLYGTAEVGGSTGNGTVFRAESADRPSDALEQERAVELWCDQ